MVKIHYLEKWSKGLVYFFLCLFNVVGISRNGFRQIRKIEVDEIIVEIETRHPSPNSLKRFEKR